MCWASRTQGPHSLGEHSFPEILGSGVEKGSATGQRRQHNLFGVLSGRLQGPRHCGVHRLQDAAGKCGHGADRCGQLGKPSLDPALG